MLADIDVEQGSGSTLGTLLPLERRPRPVGSDSESGRGPTAPSSRGENRGQTSPVRDFEQERARAAARRALFGIEEDRTQAIGRYRIEDRIGAGGMGEVYRGFDDELERPVAIKLVLPHLGHGRAHERLRREARALARLSHPNVVQVYEVGQHDERTFLAMEFVEGGTLTRWLRAQTRSWTMILERFVAAGRGLAAAHAAEITHRDFKPDNVLMTVDGRVRVADFGLAFTDRPMAGAEGDETSPGSDARLSRVGSVLGTVRYMPLEQLCGGEVDARADQFAFCVALYEALWGQPPFPIANMVERLEALERREAITPPRGVPRSLWRVIRRGLAREPEGRWPDMESLLAALEAIPRRRRRMAIAGVVAPLAGLLVVMGRASEPAAVPVDPCAEVGQSLDDRWNPERGEALAQAFEATGLSFAPASASTVRKGLDAWGAGWLEQRDLLCRATVAQQAPDAVLGLRGACLDRQRDQFGATVDVLLEADGSTVTRAFEQLAALPSPEGCNDDEGLLLGVRPPAAAQVESVAALRRELARSQAERLAGHPDVARERVKPALRTAEALGYRPVLAEALAEAGEVEIDLGHRDAGIERLERAVDLAEATRHDPLVARIWLDLAWQTLVNARDEQRGVPQLRRAEAATERLGTDELSGSRLEVMRAQRALLSGDRVAAEAQLRAALRMLDASEHSAVPLVRPGVLGRLAQVVLEEGRMDEGLTLLRESVRAAELGFGEDHPEVALQLFALGQALQAAGRDEAAAVPLARAVSLWADGPYETSPDVGQTELSRIQLAVNEGEIDQAEQWVREAEASFGRRLPPMHRRHGDLAMAEAVIAEQRGDGDRALAAFERAAEQYEQSLGPDASILGEVRLNLALIDLQLERFDDARRQLQAALAVGEGLHGTPARFALAVVLLHDGDEDGARAQLDAIEGARETFDAEERAEHALLDALVRLRRTGSARPLVDDVLSIFGEPEHPLHDHLRWLAQLGAMTDAEGRRLGIEPLTTPTNH